MESRISAIFAFILTEKRAHGRKASATKLTH